MKNYKLTWGGKHNVSIPKLFGESLELTTIVVSGSSFEGSSSIQTHEDMNVGDTVLAASIVGLPDTDDASEFLLWEYTGSDIASVSGNPTILAANTVSPTFISSCVCIEELPSNDEPLTTIVVSSSDSPNNLGILTLCFPPHVNL
jgi:hypothetical protein